MPTEHGDAQLGGLRREHLVAAAMVAAVTVVLGFASGFGVLPGAAVAAPASPVTGQPGGQQVAPPAAGPPPAGARRPGGMQVGIRPGSQGTSGTATGTGSVSGVGPGFGPGFDAGPGFGSDVGSLPANPPGPGSAPVAPPVGPVATSPQCPPGVLDQLLALIAQILGGAQPAQALSASGAVTLSPPQTGAVDPSLGEVVTLLPIGDGWTVAVVGLVPLLDTIDQRDDARREATLQAAQPAAVPVAAAPLSAAPGDQLAQLAALLSPLGLAVDPASGATDPLLAPVLGSLGCTGFVPAPPQAAPAQAAIR